MTVQAFYRGSLWIPLLVPSAGAIAVHALGVRPETSLVAKAVQLLLASLIYGGIPYLLLAGWATWWIDDRPEAEIRRRAIRAPLWMLLIWTPFAALIGILFRKIEAFIGYMGIGTLFIVVLGYAYVALVLGMRVALGRVGWLEPAPPDYPRLRSSGTSDL